MTSYGADPAPTVRGASEAAFNYYSRLARAKAYGVRNRIDAVQKERGNAK